MKADQSCAKHPTRKLYEAWERADGQQMTFAPEDHLDIQAHRRCAKDGGWKLLYTFEADTWEQAMAEHAKRQGWGAYTPMDIHRCVQSAECCARAAAGHSCQER